MASTVKTFVDDTDPECAAKDLNGFKNENSNLIIGAGLTPADTDLQQTHKAVSVYAHGGNFYSDTGIANAYALNPIGAKIAPPAYFDGMAVVFAPGNANTGASTVNVSSLGAKNIYLNGAALTGGEIPAGAVTVLRYSLSNDRFDVEYITTLLTSFSKRGCLLTRNTVQSIPNVTPTAIIYDGANSTEVYDTDGFHDPGVNPTRFTIPAGVSQVRLSGVMFFSPHATGYRQADIYKNGARFQGSPVASIPVNSGTNNTIIMIESPEVDVSPGDFFELIMYQNSGGALNYTGDANISWFHLRVIR